MDAVNLENAVYIEKDKLKDDMLYLESLLENDHSIIHNENGDFIIEKEQAFSPVYHNDIIKRLSHDMGIDLAIYIKENDGFHCITSSILDSDGNPAVNIFLREDSAAYACIQSGMDFIGKDVILGNDYLTLYRPLFQPETNEVIGILFTGIKMEAIKNIISHKNDKPDTQLILIRICAIALGTSLIIILITILNHRYRSEKTLNILKNILNGIDAMIYVTVPETCEILFINDYMKNIFNIKEDCVGQLCYKVFTRNGDKKCDFCPCWQLDKAPGSTVVWEKENPLVKRVHRNIDRYIEWHNGKIVHIQHSIDITDLITAKEQAEQSSRFKSQFLSRMSHEVRTPMNAILGITEIQLQNETLPDDLRKALDKIFNSGYLLLGIINDILDLSKIDAGKLELSPTEYDLPNLINDTVPITVMYYEHKPIVFKLHVDENTPLTLFGDELRIKQILNNLLSNAFKYTDKGEVSLSVSAEYSSRQSEQVTLVFNVADTGYGMTDEQVDKLFDEYSRFNIKANHTTEGTGLGMSITKQLVHMMNGDIFVKSEPGEGSVFTVRLPQGIVGTKVLGGELADNIRQFNACLITQINKMPQFVREYMPYGRVLVVDDVETNLYVARGLMAPYGLSIETAVSGFETIKKIKDGAVYDIIFMDHFMPKMDGIETVKKLRVLGYMRPIIALTANALAGQAEVFLENGFDGFISKPIDIRQLNVSLNKYVRDKYPLEVIEAARRQTARLMARTSVEKVKPSGGSELAALFMRDAEKALSALKTIISGSFSNKDDLLEYTINVHSMKSALANISETRLSNTAHKLELAGHSENIQVIMAETPAFLKQLEEVIKRNVRI
jgi:signal transduction histidine kinase/CheY-like chemotaxis protein/HPt (histidine-containing phosphotransfer) domain-containing protein